MQGISRSKRSLSASPQTAPRSVGTPLQSTPCVRPHNSRPWLERLLCLSDTPHAQLSCMLVMQPYLLPIKQGTPACGHIFQRRMQSKVFVMNQSSHCVLR